MLKSASCYFTVFISYRELFFPPSLWRFELHCRVNESLSCWRNDDSRRRIRVKGKAFAITRADVCKHMPLLIFNAVVCVWFFFYLMHLITENVSGRMGSFILSICLVFCQPEINIQTWSQTGWLAFSHTCSHGAHGWTPEWTWWPNCTQSQVLSMCQNWCNHNSMAQYGFIHSDRGREANDSHSWDTCHPLPEM